MKCAKCSTEVTVADSHCPKCKSDLLAFGSSVFYEKSKHESDVSSPATEVVFGAVANEFKASLSGFNFYEKKIFSPALQMVKKVFSRHLSEEEIDRIFDAEILPVVDDLSKDKENEEVFRTVEENIRENLKAHAYNHYRVKGEDVLKILRAGELALILMKDKTVDMDLSVKMFPYFKASEKSCWIHTRKRYQELKDNPLIEEISEWLGRNYDNILIEEIPKWLADRKKTLIEVMNGITTENGYYVNGSLRTGIAIYALGRTWRMKVRRSDLSQEKTFQINNILRTGGADREKELLSENLQKFQGLRNERMHKDVEGDEKAVNQSRRLSYECLKMLPELLSI